MQEILHQYKIRLTNLSQGNRSLKLNRLSSYRDLDLTEASHLEKLSAEELLERIIRRKKTVLLKKLSARLEKSNLLDQKLNKIYREVGSIEAETGQYDLALGYPWVRGRFIDGNHVSCPVFLFPLRLKKNLQGGNRWELECPEGSQVRLNPTFFLAYEKFQQQRFSKEFWEHEWPENTDIQEFLNHAYQHFKDHHLEINFNRDLFQLKLSSFQAQGDDLLNKEGLGKLKFHPYAVLGIFPQASSSLLLDYEVIAEQVDKFPLQNILQSGQSQPGIPSIPESEKYFVAPVDEAQEEALLRARSGQSLVVHGPPGTGKSQVILNLISDAMATGKRVLLCSQKKAALDVVFDRLQDLNLSRFCARIHDIRNDRQELYAHIRKQIEDIESFREERMDLTLKQWEREMRHDSRKIDEYIRLYDDLQKALLSEETFGISAHELYQSATKRDRSLDLSGLGTQYNYRSLQDFREKLSLILNFRDFFQPSFFWSKRKNLSKWGESEKQSLIQALNLYQEKLPVLARLHSLLGLDLSDIPKAQASKSIIEDLRQAEVIFAQEDFHTAYVLLRSKKTKFSLLQEAKDRLAIYLSKKKYFTYLSNIQEKKVPNLNHHCNVYEEKRGSLLRFFDAEWKASRDFLKKFLNSDLNPQVLGRLKKECKVVTDFIRDFYPNFSLDPLITQLYTEQPADQFYQSLCTIINNWKALQRIQSFREWLPKVKNGVIDFKTYEQQKEKKTLLEDFCRLWQDVKQRLHVHLPESQVQYMKGWIAAPASGSIKKVQDEFISHFEDLRSLDRLISELSPLEKELLQRLQTSLEDGAIPTEDLPDWMINEFYQEWIEQLESRYGVLTEVSSKIAEEKRKDFSLKVKERHSKVISLIDSKIKSEILDKIEYNRLRNPVTYRDMLHQVSKKRRLWPARKLISTFWDDGLSRLLPCWLASPESASAIFPMEPGFFDLIIFDEASQCYVEKALPVVLRGKTVVIAGDEQQLRPFDLYTVKPDEAEGDFFENEMAIEVESILELARNSFHNCHLTWHYRSLHDALIRFSNQAFYEGRLQMVDAPKGDPHFLPPIRWVQVEGKWERNRNLAEARKAIDLVIELLSKDLPPSIGIVSMNHAQQEALKDELEKRYEACIQSGNEKLITCFDHALNTEIATERLFIKNIENVQGDERDVIIFSLAYSPNNKGRVPSRFGLLNMAGGENRLNVAISRARKQVNILSSFVPEQLEVEGATHPGPKLFRKYLQYARSVNRGEDRLQELLGQSGSLKPSGQQAQDLLILRIREALHKRGYATETGIGKTGYKIDIGVLDKDKGSFICGIECEGSGYFRGKSAKSREVYRRRMLQERGWRMYRVWARNFYMNPAAEVDRIERFIKG